MKVARTVVAESVDASKTGHRLPEGASTARMLRAGPKENEMITTMECRRCGFSVHDEREPLDQQQIPNCSQHPARVDGWIGSTPHDFVTMRVFVQNPGEWDEGCYTVDPLSRGMVDSNAFDVFNPGDKVRVAIDRGYQVDDATGERYFVKRGGWRVARVLAVWACADRNTNNDNKRNVFVAVVDREGRLTLTCNPALVIPHGGAS